MRMKWWQVALGVSLLLAILSPLASSSPDGLEKVAEGGGFAGLTQGAPIRLIADYLFPGIENQVVAAILAGVTGVIIVFTLTLGLAWVVKSRKAR
jgi:hypothetical protein